jgi:hypothetical protein
VQGVKNSVPLELELLFLFLRKSQLTLVESLHFVDEYLVSLQLEMLVRLDSVRDALRQSVPLLALGANARLVIVDAANDFLLGSLLLLLLDRRVEGLALLAYFGLEKSEGSAALIMGCGRRCVQQLHSF